MSGALVGPPSGVEGGRTGTAWLSSCGRYRYELTRVWGENPANLATWILLNPSTGDATRLDATLRRCRGFSAGWGYDGMRVVNLFAWRSTDPRGLVKTADPVGPDNDAVLAGVGTAGGLVVAGWGAVHGAAAARAARVRSVLGTDVRCLGLTSSGQPRHPLYLPGSAVLRPYGAACPARRRDGRAREDHTTSDCDTAKMIGVDGGDLRTAPEAESWPASADRAGRR